ncbi:Hypothetical protein R9X50_00738300 [Acrodontium crateriforme]|uniref:DUF924-domain-containing protein n=1 Tax=Acrodontium crateriforme TaxID=150365 RepID=A0AAQ3MBE4_9PEZI|nr:Hypothetical protein R9X50_00738300 [Acrodontium crateriforme]
MLFRPLIQRAVLAQFTASSVRRFSAAAMATPPQSFVLDRSLFNQSLYDELRNFWFDGLSDQTTSPPFTLMQKWFGVGKTDAERAAFDDECRAKFGAALESVGPKHLALPPFMSYESDIANASTIAAPFVAEVQTARKEDDKKGAETLLSLILLLDQMPRNIHRDPEGLKLLYSFYDRLGFALLQNTLATSPELLKVWRGSVLYGPWLNMPFVHSEHEPSHRYIKEDMEKQKAEIQAASGDEDALNYVDRALKSYDQHREPIEKFGRYPHRNECLGRQNTKEEEKYLETAETFGVKQKSSKKDEL